VASSSRLRQRHRWRCELAVTAAFQRAPWAKSRSTCWAALAPSSGPDSRPTRVATLDELRRRRPEYQSGEGHLLYARSLEEIGRTDEAIEEYKALAGYFPGAEARVRYGLLLDRLDRQTEARVVLSDLLTHMRRAPKHVRKVQAEWIGMAEKALRS
jgi:hypothetical protein